MEISIHVFRVDFCVLFKKLGRNVVLFFALLSCLYFRYISLYFTSTEIKSINRSQKEAKYLSMTCAKFSIQVTIPYIGQALTTVCISDQRHQGQGTPGSSWR